MSFRTKDTIKLQEAYQKILKENHEDYHDFEHLDAKELEEKDIKTEKNKEAEIDVHDDRYLVKFDYQVLRDHKKVQYDSLDPVHDEVIIKIKIHHITKIENSGDVEIHYDEYSDPVIKLYNFIKERIRHHLLSQEY
jgi:hypothetical protein